MMSGRSSYTDTEESVVMQTLVPKRQGRRSLLPKNTNIKSLWYNWSQESNLVPAVPEADMLRIGQLVVGLSLSGAYLC